MGVVIDYTVAYNIYLVFLLLILLFFSLFKLYGIFVKGRNAEENQKKAKYNPRVLVIVPCKGLDLTLEQNLKSIKAQDYGNCKMLAVVDSKEDAAVEAINNAGIDYLISKRTSPAGSGKVHAISTAISKAGNFDVYVIADSDILVKKDWLKLLIQPLKDLNTGIATTFPRFEPAGGFWSEAKLVWGFVGLGLMESKMTRFGWGGSIAFRKDIFDYGPYFKTFREALSDDIALVKIAAQKELGIAYVPDAAPVVNSADDFKTFWEWSNRQTALFLLENRKLFGIGFVFYGLQLLLFISGIVLAATVSPLFLVMLLPTVLGIIQDLKRAGTVSPSLIVASIIMPFLYFTNILIGRSMKKILWRGTHYDLA
jgi:hypothetical protein